MTSAGMTVAAATATLLMAGTASAGQTPEQKCQQQRYNAAAKYVSCQQKAVGKHLGTGSYPFYGASRKCVAKYAARWAKLKAIGVAPCLDERFISNADGTVTDNLTGLVWEKKGNEDSIPNLGDPHDADNSYAWTAGFPAATGGAFTTFLETLNNSPSCFAGQCDWRLPTVAELASILSLSPDSPYDCAVTPCIDTSTFGPTPFNVPYYWTSITSAVDPEFAWMVILSDGSVVFTSKGDLERVRAVRGGL